MTISPLLVYVIGILDKFHIVVGIFLLCLGVLLAIFGIFYAVVHFDGSFDSQDIERVHKYKPTLRKMAIATVFLACLKVFVPNTGLVAAMYIIPAVVNNEKVQNIGDNLLNTLQGLTNKWMVDVLKDIRIDPKEQEKKNSHEQDMKERSI